MLNIQCEVEMETQLANLKNWKTHVIILNVIKPLFNSSNCYIN